jgi:predicted acyl esterase
MPCFDGGVPYPPSREEVLTAKMPAVLCGIVTYMGIDVLVEMVNWQEAGVTPAEFREWWRLHQRDDEVRRVREARDKRRAELRLQAEGKLTPEELDVIKERS